MVMVSTRTSLLTSVNVMWRERQEALGFLPHVAALISAFLDSSGPLSMTSSTYSSAEAAAAATAALQATTGFHEMEHSISEQGALLRSLQNEYAKMSMNRTPQRSQSNPSFNQMRENRLAEWQAAERTQPIPNQYDIDIDD